MIIEDKISKKILFGLIRLEQFRYTKTYFLFGIIPVLQITKYPKVEVFNAKN